MAVIGVGVDLVDVGSFAEQLDVPGSRFTSSAFTVGERTDAAGAPERLAARWAAKEAFVKAWAGSRLGRAAALPTWSPDAVEVALDAEGRPGLVLRGALADALADLHPGGVTAHVSLSHDGGVAAAVVVLDAAGEPAP